MLDLKSVTLMLWKHLEENDQGQIEVTLTDGRKIIVIIDAEAKRPDLKLVSGND